MASIYQQQPTVESNAPPYSPPHSSRTTSDKYTKKPYRIRIPRCFTNQTRKACQVNCTPTTKFLSICFLIFLVFVIIHLITGSVIIYYTIYNERGGQTKIFQTQKATLYPIGEVDASNRHMLTFTQTGTPHIIPIRFYISGYDDYNVSEVFINTQGDLPPIATIPLDVQYILFDTILTFKLEIPVDLDIISSDCFLYLLVFSDSAAYQTFLNRGIWSRRNLYKEICVQQYNFTTSITLRGKLYYYSGLYIPFESQQHISGKVKYQITGVAWQYDIDTFISACTVNQTSTCTVQFSSLGIEEATVTARVCIIGYLPAGQGTDIKNAVIEYKTDGFPVSTRDSVLKWLLGDVIMLPCACCAILRSVWSLVSDDD